jgi:hypothetical protein
MSGQSSAHAVTYPFLRKSFQTIGYTSTNSFLARRFSVLGNSTRTVGYGLGLDVLILRFDSLSHMTYRRKLTKTYKYFTENLKGIVLNGYNIVSFSTTQT